MSFDSAKKTQTAYNKLKNSTSVEFVEIDEKLKTGIEGEKESKYDSVSVSETELASFLRLQENKKNIVVAVLDTGIDSSILQDKVIDLGLNYSKSGEKGRIQDDNGHGTELAKLILENSNENVKIMPIKVADSDGNSSVYQTYQGIMAAIENGVDIINISMNSNNTKESNILEEAINKAEENGIKVVVSSGNDKIDTKYVIPSNIDKAIVVGAVAENNLIEKYSNFGDEVDYSAYGMYNGKSGTSYAAARITGILANAMTKGYSEEILEKYAIDLGDKGKDKYFGNGFIGLTHNDIDEYTIPNDYFESTIFEKDWKNMTTEELDEVIDNSENAHLAVFISHLSDEDLKLILSKSKLLNGDYVSTGDKEGDVPPKYWEYLYNLYSEDEMKISGSVTNKEGYFFIYIKGAGTTQSKVRINTKLTTTNVGSSQNVTYAINDANPQNNHSITIYTDTTSSYSTKVTHIVENGSNYKNYSFAFKYKKPAHTICSFSKTDYCTTNNDRFNDYKYTPKISDRIKYSK